MCGMSTSKVLLSTTDYVRVNFALNPIVIEVSEGVVKVCMTVNKPSLSNTAFHYMREDQRLVFDNPDSNIWILATSAIQKCVVTEQARVFSGFDVAAGNVPGESAFSKFGRNPDINTASDPEDVWNGGGLYTGFPLGAAETLEIFSSDVNDTSAGTGARTVLVSNLLDVNGAIQPDVIVSLNGTTPVIIGAGLYYRCNQMKVLTAGSSGENLGSLTLRHSVTTANVFSVMSVGNNESTVCAYTVPLGYTLYIDNISMQLARLGGVSGSANMSLRARPLGEVFQSKITPTITDGGPFVGNDIYRVFTALTDIVVRVDSVSNNSTIVTANLGGILVLNI